MIPVFILWFVLPDPTHAADPELKVGMVYDEAIRMLEAEDAAIFNCGYSFIIQEGKESHEEHSWYTLPTGLSVVITGDKENKSVQLKVVKLEVCNSSMLFCCKGESWYPVEVLKLGRESILFQGFKGAIIHKGMRLEDALRVIAQVKLKESLSNAK